MGFLTIIKENKQYRKAINDFSKNKLDGNLTEYHENRIFGHLMPFLIEGKAFSLEAIKSTIINIKAFNKVHRKCASNKILNSFLEQYKTERSNLVLFKDIPNKYVWRNWVIVMVAFSVDHGKSLKLKPLREFINTMYKCNRNEHPMFLDIMLRSA